MINQILLTTAVVLGAYESFKALESDGNASSVSDMLKFWVFLGVLQMSMPTMDFCLSWVPLYETIKFSIYLGCATKNLRKFATKQFFWPIVVPIHKYIRKHTERIVAISSSKVLVAGSKTLVTLTKNLQCYASDDSVSVALGEISTLSASLKMENTRRLQRSVQSLFEAKDSDSVEVGSPRENQLIENGEPEMKKERLEKGVEGKVLLSVSEYEDDSEDQILFSINENCMEEPLEAGGKGVTKSAQKYITPEGGHPAGESLESARRRYLPRRRRPTRAYLRNIDESLNGE
eukprot:CAMPEP_0197526262 /NCGR_PEP_ID=MMETSP1318-20131121/17064_1 /TAXON_ID=552666 /ORGANISM="Partenskyella glossopodia, Strain RCC365" /LENGTH=289 /DNA_ID=CAMNT_0043080355 /DNA_START=12 /DNA_END=879 /DNA_ORIENTATION=+